MLQSIEADLEEAYTAVGTKKDKLKNRAIQDNRCSRKATLFESTCRRNRFPWTSIEASVAIEDG